MTEAQRLLQALQAKPSPESLQELDEHLSQLVYHLSVQLPYQTLPEDFPAEELFLQLDLCRDEARLVLMQEEGEERDFHLDGALQALSEVERLLEILKQIEAEQPRFAALPWVHELCRVAVACQQDQLPAEALWERLAGGRELYQELWLAVSQLRPPFWEQERGQQLQSAFSEGLESLLQGLDHVELFGNEGDAELLDMGLELLAQGAQQVHDAYQRLQEVEADYALGLPCPKCEHRNPPGSRRCDACGATLPVAEWLESRDLEDGGWPDLVAALLASLQALQQAQALAQLTDLERRFERGYAYFEKLQPAPEVAALRQQILESSRLCSEQLAALRGPLEEGQWDQVGLIQAQFLTQLQELLRHQDRLQSQIESGA